MPQLRVVFDLDGTLIDSLRDLSDSASELVSSLGGRSLTMDAISTMIGEGAKVLVRRVLVAAELDPGTPGALEAFLAIYDRRLLNHTVPYPGTYEVLQMAARCARLAVLTNKPAEPSRRILDALDLSPFFDAVIGGDGPHGRKPALGGLRELAAGSTSLLLVGDSPIDWETASAAGCGFAWARYGFGAPRFDVAPDTPYVLDRPADLSSVLDRYIGVMSGG